MATSELTSQGRELLWARSFLGCAHMGDMRELAALFKEAHTYLSTQPVAMYVLSYLAYLQIARETPQKRTTRIVEILDSESQSTMTDLFRKFLLDCHTTGDLYHAAVLPLINHLVKVVETVTDDHDLPIHSRRHALLEMSSRPHCVVIDTLKEHWGDTYMEHTFYSPETDMSKHRVHYTKEEFDIISSISEKFRLISDGYSERMAVIQSLLTRTPPPSDLERAILIWLREEFTSHGE